MQFSSKLVFSFFYCTSVCLQAAPTWWSDDSYQFVDPSGTENDHAVVLQGQAKQAVAASKTYFDDKFIQFGGAGEDVDTLFVSDWFTTSTYDYNALLNGQLKSIAHPFYVRLEELGIPLSLVGFGSNYTDKFPWTNDDPADDADFSPALIGQVKYVFSFDLNLSQDGDGIPDWWEYVFKTDPDVNTDNSTTDSDGDSRIDITEYIEKTDPTDYYDGTLPTLTIVSGNNQQINPEYSVIEPIVVRVEKDSASLSNAPVEISLAPIDSGEINVEGSTGPNLSARTDGSGELSVKYNPKSDFQGTVIIDFLAQSDINQASVQATLNVIKEITFFLFGGPNQTYFYDGTEVSASGRNYFNQLVGQTAPVVGQFTRLTDLPSGISKIANGSDHTLLLTATGSVYVWGDNFFGQLGLGDFQGRSTPTLVPNLNNVIDVAAGDGFSCFLVDNQDGTTTVYLSGNLQDGLKADVEVSNVPVESGQTNYSHAIKLSASGRHILVLCTDRSVWGWGQNRFGQAAPALTTDSLSEATRIIDSNIVKVATSGDNSLAITDSGELIAWGNTAFDQLKSGTPDVDAETHILGQNVTSAVLGNGFIAYLSDDGLTTAGLNNSGQLGRDTKGQMIAPAATVTRPDTGAITNIISGDRHSVYLTEAGEFYGFGDNRQGALGFGITTQLATPTRLTSNLN